MAKQLFGTDGMRGVANTFPMTPEMMVKIGLVVGNLLKGNAGKILIGRDPRMSGQMLECALTAGIVAAGTDVLLAGVIPTPAVPFLTGKLGADAGIVISASHNSALDNGIKIFAHDGFKLPDELEAEIEKRVLGEEIVFGRPTGAAIGKIHRIPDVEAQYVEHLVQTVFGETLPNLHGVSIVIDCANGAASEVAPAAFRRLGFEPIVLAASPDGLNINRNCGALHTETLQKQVIQEHAAMGFAFDGDADRLILVDERGERVDGDQIIAMLAFDLVAKGRLNKNSVVITVMSNLGLECALREAGIQVVRTPVGDRYVVQKMQAIGANLGGEQSGHLVMFDHGPAGDGLITALAVLHLVQATGKPVSQLASCFKPFPQTLVNIPVHARTPFEEMPGVSAAIHKAEQELGERGRVLVRYSGTELLARIMVEAEDEATVQRIAETIAAAIRQENEEHQT